MSGTVNKVILIGYLGAEPRVARTAAGKPVVSFSMATSESWRDAAGTRHEATDWHGVVFSEPLADFAGKYLRKGSKVYVEGKQKTREYEDRGVKKRITEVVLTGFNCRLDSLDKAEGRPPRPTIRTPTAPPAPRRPRPPTTSTKSRCEARKMTDSKDIGNTTTHGAAPDQQAQFDEAAIAEFAEDLKGMSLADIDAAISEASDQIDEVEPWLEALCAMRRRLAPAAETAAVAASPDAPVAPATRWFGLPLGHVEIEHDGFRGEIIGHYITREGKRGAVVQQAGTKVVHVYAERWLTPQPRIEPLPFVNTLETEHRWLAQIGDAHRRRAEAAEAERDRLRAEIAKEKERADKFMWQVSDTCTRAEKAEAALGASVPQSVITEAVSRAMRPPVAMTKDDAAAWCEPLEYFLDVLKDELAVTPEPTSTARAEYYFGSLVDRARGEAARAAAKYPQPNFIALKVAEEAGEVVRGCVHYAEGRMKWAEVEDEIVQLLAMLVRLVTEGDQVNGITPPAAAPWNPALR